MADWKHLPKEMMILIAQKLDFLQDFTRLSATCKSRRWALSELQEYDQKPLQLCRHPWLLLAEDTGLDLSATRVSHAEASHKILGPCRVSCFDDDQTKKFDEATDRVILATSNGWLVTLGRDLEINLLHPLLKHQISLPPMLAFCIQYEYNDYFSPQEVYTRFIHKVVMSSNIPTKSAFEHEEGNSVPTIMAIYGESMRLAFARVGDKLWSDVKNAEEDDCFEDIVCHKDMFYAIDCYGDIYTCEPDHNIDKRQVDLVLHKIPIKNYITEYRTHFRCYYLVESSSGSHIWVVFRRRNGEYFKSGKSTPGQPRYYTSDFVVFKLEIQYSACGSNPVYNWTTSVKDLGNETLFIGRASSKSVVSSEFIKSNSIYFMDDLREIFHKGAGGHDMGIFDMKTGTIQPHFEGISVHPFSPPLWYF